MILQIQNNRFGALFSFVSAVSLSRVASSANQTGHGGLGWKGIPNYFRWQGYDNEILWCMRNNYHRSFESPNGEFYSKCMEKAITILDSDDTEDDPFTLQIRLKLFMFFFKKESLKQKELCVFYYSYYN